MLLKLVAVSLASHPDVLCLVETWLSDDILDIHWWQYHLRCNFVL